jgi:hypothetical protein
MLRGRQGFVRLAAVAALGLTCLAAAACSGPPDPLAGLTAKQVLTQAMANFKAAPSLTVDGLVSEPAAADSAPAAPGMTLEALVRGPIANVTVHLGLVPGKGCTGTAETLANGSTTFIVADQAIYLQPDGAWWDTVAGSGGTGISQLIGDRYLKESAAESGQSVTDTCALNPLAALSTPTVIKGQVTTLNGIRVLPLNGAHDYVLYVTDTTKPEIAGIFQPEPDSNGDYVNLTVRVGAPVALAAPSPGQAVDASDFGLAANSDGDENPPANVGSTIMARAYANLKAAPTVTMTGILMDVGPGYPVADVDLGLRPAQGCAGTVDYGSKGSIKLVVVDGTVYYDPDTTFWDANAGADAQAAINLFNGRYIEVPESDSNGKPIAALCDMSSDIGSLQTGSVTVGKVTTLDGVRVLPLTDSSGAVVDVSDTGKLQIVQITDPPQSGSDQPFGTLHFKVGTPVTLTPPPPSQVFAGSTAGL